LVTVSLLKSIIFFDWNARALACNVAGRAT
jgi:hypothetical protein